MDREPNDPNPNPYIPNPYNPAYGLRRHWARILCSKRRDRFYLRAMKRYLENEIKIINEIQHPDIGLLLYRKSLHEDLRFIKEELAILSA